MWFFFGFITLAGFIAYTVYQRLDARWKGEPGQARGLRYQFREHKNKDKLVKLQIGIDAPPGFDFALKPETDLDDFFKSLGVSREYQLQDEAFDRAVYIVSDDEGVCRRLAALPELRASILKLFTVQGQAYLIDGVRCHQGRLWARYRPDGEPEAGDADLLAKLAVPILYDIARALEGVPVDRGVRWRDPFVLRATLILACSSGLAINGAVQLYRVHWNDFPYTQDWQNLLPPAVAGGAALVALLAAATVIFLKRSARTHLVLLEILIVGSFGALATAFVEARDLNMEWDRGPAAVYETTVLGKSVSRSRRSFSRYYLHVDARTFPWDEKIRVPSAAYDRVARGDRIVLQVRPGFLGARWVARIEGPRGLIVE